MSKVPTGAHVSMAKGYAAAFEEALALGATALQLFAKSPRSGTLRKVTKGESVEVATLANRKKIRYAIIHSSYLLNFAKPLAKSSFEMRSLLDDLHSADLLGADGVVLHMGKTVGQEPTTARENFVHSVALAIKESSGLHAKILLENTAGQGTELGYRLDEFGTIFKAIQKLLSPAERKRLGVCLDTAHAFGAGYDLGNQNGIDELFEIFKKHVGLDALCCVHFNDSKKEVGSRVDRHEDIGFGKIGQSGLKKFVDTLQKLSKKEIPLILETPATHNDYSSQLQTLSGWL